MKDFELRSKIECHMYDYFIFPLKVVGYAFDGSVFNEIFRLSTSLAVITTDMREQLTDDVQL